VAWPFGCQVNSMSDASMSQCATAPRPDHFYLVKEIAVVSQTELVVAPVPMTVDPRIEMKLIPKHARVTEFDVSIMVGTEQSYVHGHCPYLLPRADCGLGQRYTLKPCVMRTPVIVAIVVPV